MFLQRYKNLLINNKYLLIFSVKNFFPNFGLQNAVSCLRNLKRESGAKPELCPQR